MRMQDASGQLGQYHLLSQVKRDIARVKNGHSRKNRINFLRSRGGKMSSTNPRTLSGLVVSDRMDKTKNCESGKKSKTPGLWEVHSKIDKVACADGDNECRVGDSVTVFECRPLSKSKTWMLKSIAQKDQESWEYDSD
ncbi:MAG: hypothetical protein Ct9H90mP27_0820 [Gammaproteobacteria bacterium]|nr:MAG: hypothetical protein Ct9H90mP27_0820 [Gammaproteobacteria bacterium]